MCACPTHLGICMSYFGTTRTSLLKTNGSGFNQTTKYTICYCVGLLMCDASKRIKHVSDSFKNTYFSRLTL